LVSGVAAKLVAVPATSTAANDAITFDLFRILFDIHPPWVG
jgi:hypothetical protein